MALRSRKRSEEVGTTGRSPRWTQQRGARKPLLLRCGSRKKARKRKAADGIWRLSGPRDGPFSLDPLSLSFPEVSVTCARFFPPALEGSPLPWGHVTVLPASRNRTREAGPLEMGPLALGSARRGSAAAYAPCRPECSAVQGAAHMLADAGTDAATRPEDNALRP
ncbi:hypothetical protein MRX96_042349 [Rhipicephalus microplus]